MLAGVLMPDDPPLPADLVLSPGTGSLVFAGQVSDILPLPLLPRDSITPGTGALAFAGNVSTIYTTTPSILSPTSGALVFAGNPSTILVNSVGVGPTVAPGTGDLTLTGFPPVVTIILPITTWNPSDKSASVSLSSGDTVATNDTFGRHAVRAVAGKSTGKWAFRVTPTIGTSVETLIGIATSSASLNNGIGLDDNAYGYNASNGVVYKNTVGQATYQLYSSGQPVDVCCDFDNNRMWVRRNNGNWNNDATANPATNTGGLDISALTGTKYPAWSGINAGDTATLDTFAPLPSGFLTWG
jgi:hypothetical protein